MNIFNLPEDVIIMILYEFLFLKECTIFDTVICNKKYRLFILAIFKKLPSLDTIIKNSNTKKYNLSDFYKWISIREIKINSFELDYNYNYHNLIKYQEINKICIKCYGEEDNVEIINSCVNLEKIILHTIHSNTFLLNIKPEIFSNLTSIELYNDTLSIDISPITNYCRNLEFFYSVRDDVLSIIQNNLNLKELHLSYCQDDIIMELKNHINFEQIKLFSMTDIHHILDILDNNIKINKFHINGRLFYEKNNKLILNDNLTKNNFILSNSIYTEILLANVEKDEIIKNLIKKSYKSLSILQIIDSNISSSMIKEIYDNCINISTLVIHCHHLNFKEIINIFNLNIKTSKLQNPTQNELYEYLEQNQNMYIDFFEIAGNRIYYELNEK